MSVDIIARALALAATPVASTAAGISTLRPATSVGVIQTSGYSTPGEGAALYVSDGLANAALAIAHPRFCRADSNGRYWRLMGDEVAFEQGGAHAAAGFDNRTAIQAALNYARAVGIRRVQPEQDHATYELWAPTVSVANTYNAFDRDGLYDFITLSADVAVWGRGATWNLKAWNGGSLQTVTQTITYLGSPTAWRGNGINVIGGTAGTGSYNVRKVSIHNLTVDGGCDRVRGASSAAELVFSDYISHKGLRIQDTQVGELFFENVTLRRFRGEVWYLGMDAGMGSEAYGHPRITLLNCRGYGSNQSALNPGAGRLTVIGGEYGDAPIAMEALGGAGHSFLGTRFYDAWSLGLWGGAKYNGVSSCLFAGMTDTGAEALPPWSVFLDVTMDNCISATFNSLVRGNIRAIDTYFLIESLTPGQARNFDLALDITTHKVSATAAVTIQGPATATTLWGNGTGGFVQPVKSGNLQVSHRRTAYAKTNSIHAAALLQFGGLIEQDTVGVTVLASEAESLVMPLANTDANAKAMPRIYTPNATALGVEDGSGLPLGGRSVSFGTGGVATPTYTFNGHSAYTALNHVGLAGTTTIAMGAPYTGPYNYAFGQRVRIEWNANATAGTVLLFPKAGTRLRLLADRRLTQRGEWIELEYDAYIDKWLEAGFSSGTATDTGWTAGTGTALKAGFAAYAGATMGAAYVQAEAQASNDAARIASQRLLALEQAMRAAGLVN